MVKVISLSNEAYEKLKAMKRGRSFSEVVLEEVGNKKKKKSIMDFYGIWKDDAEYWENFKKEIRKSRDRAKLREYKW